MREQKKEKRAVKISIQTKISTVKMNRTKLLMVSTTMPILAMTSMHDKNSDLSDENSHLAPSSHDSEKEIEMNQFTTAKR